MNSKWITNLNLRAKTIKLKEENMGGKPCDLELGQDFLHTTTNALYIHK